MVPQSGRKEFQSDNRFWMNPALPDSLYHSAARPERRSTGFYASLCWRRYREMLSHFS